MKKTMDKVPPRLQRMMLNLQPYDMHVHYVPGKFMYLADTLSRAYLPIQNADHEDQEIDYVVHSIIKHLPITTSKLDEFREATARDSTLQTVVKYCKNGWPKAQRNVPANVGTFNTGIFAIRFTFSKALFSPILVLSLLLNCKLKCLRLFMKVILALKSVRRVRVNCCIGHACHTTLNR